MCQTYSDRVALCYGMRYKVFYVGRVGMPVFSTISKDSLRKLFTIRRAYYIIEPLGTNLGKMGWITISNRLRRFRLFNRRQVRESKFTAIYVGLTIVMVIWGASITGLIFSPVDFGVYDIFTRLSGSSAPRQTDCLLIGADYLQADADDSVWLEALNRLNAMGDRQIVFTFMPSGVSPDFYKRAEQINGVYFGRQRVQSETIEEKTAFEPVPAQARSKSLKIGLQDIPPGSLGIHRFMQTYWEFSGHKHFHVILEAAQDITGSKRSQDQFILVNFMGGDAGIPSVDLKSLLSGDVIKEIINSKTILVGFKVPPSFPDLKTPLTPGRPGMSPLRFYAYAFDTIVTNKNIQWPGAWAKLVLVGLAVIGSMIAYQVLSPLQSVAFAAIMVPVSVTVSWFMLKFLLTWIPLSEIMTAGFFSLTAAVVIRTRYEHLGELGALLEKSGSYQSARIPESFFRSPEHWMQIANMVDQTLSIKRSVFFETIEGQRRIKKVVSLNTSLEDIGERRRTFA